MIKLLGLILLSPIIAGCANAPAGAKQDTPVPSLNGASFEIAMPKYAVPPATAWDNFQHRTNVMWACRQVVSGEFVANRFCRDQARNDRQWPGMAVPQNYRVLVID
jgi:hypothetical protein